MTRFEERHRELRAAEESTVSQGLSAPHVAASEALWKFNARTGPLVDDLVAAARLAAADDALDNGDELVRRLLVLRQKFAALDEASGG